MNPKISKRVYDIFINSIKNTNSNDDVINFINDLLSNSEKTMLAKRVAIAFMLLENKYTYHEISRTLKISFGTIAKVNSVLSQNDKGYKKIIGKMITRKIIKDIINEIFIALPHRKTLSRETYMRPI